MSILEELRPLLDKATQEERDTLAEILEAVDSSAENIAFQLQWSYQSIFGWMFKEDEDVSYTEIVIKVAKKLDINYLGVSLEDLEIQIAQHVLKATWEEMTPEQREEVESELRETAQKFDKAGAFVGSGSIFAALTGAKLSGFSIYLLATTSLGAVTSGLGITLPFAVYTTMTQTIGLFLGPLGWISAGLFAMWKITDTNYKRVIPAVICVAAIRARLREEERPDKHVGSGSLIMWIILAIVAGLVAIATVF